MMSIGAFASKAQKISPTFSMSTALIFNAKFSTLIDKDSSMLAVLNPTVYSRFDDLLISFKCSKLQILED
jgi:hypothetical protein